MKVQLLLGVLLLAGSAMAQSAIGTRPPTAADKSVDAIKEHAKSNDWASVRKAYDGLDWRTVGKPLPVLREISTALKQDKSKEARALRKEVNTKYWLLKGEKDPELPDSEPRVPVPTVPIQTVVVPVYKFKNERLFALLEQWDKRYRARVDLWDEKGFRIVPAPGTVLWAMRKRVIDAVEAGGDYDALWAEYDQAMQKAVGRRNALKRRP